MDAKKHQLLELIPQQSQRCDSAFDQLTDLIAVAEKLGMTEATNYLQPKLDMARKYTDPMPLHPDQRSGEILLFNSEKSTARYIGWKSTRIGAAAYDFDGNWEEGKVPVFVSAAEFAAAGQLTDRYTIKD